MKFISFKLIGIALVCVLILGGCQKGSVQNKAVELDNTLLKDWADDIIVPAYNNYQAKTLALQTATQQFEQTPTAEHLASVKEAWKNAFTAFQKIMIFNFKISNSVYLLEMADTYPTLPHPTQERSVAIESNINLVKSGKSEIINFRPTSEAANYTYQGFPALDYLLFSKGKDLAYFQANPAARQYMTMLADALVNNINTVVTHWTTYKNDYAKDTDTSIQGAFSLTINAFVKVYEKQIRTYKVGLACGAIREQEGQAAPEVIEAYYNEVISKDLLKTALQSTKDFFDGKSFDGTKDVKGLKQILIEKGKQDLVNDIENQYAKIFANINELPYTLRDAAGHHRERLKQVFGLLQTNVLNFKTKMMQAMQVQPDYMDTDGD